jgi:regulator of sigma E protease
MSLIFLTIIAFIVTIGFLVVIHEGGHFAAARLFGVWVHQFAVGMGPAIWRAQGPRDRIFSQNLSPSGATCAWPGKTARALKTKPSPKRDSSLQNPPGNG